MRSAARTTLEALGRFSFSRREDRLTEMFAYVLEQVPELVRWLLASVESAPAAAAGGRIEVFTQGAMAGEGRPDLHIYYQDESGAERLLLSEHKLDADLTDYQRAGYPGWERAGLLLIAKDAEKYRLEGGKFDRYLTWPQVSEEVDRLGVAQAGVEWRRAALIPSAAARLRALHELQVLLETLRVGKGSMQALTDGTVDAYAQINVARSHLSTFLELVGKDHRMRQLGSDGTICPYSKDDLKDTLWSVYVSVHWATLETIDQDCGAEVTIEPSGRWLTDEVDGAVLYAGFYFAINHGRLPQSLVNSSSFNAGLHDAGAVMAAQNQRQAKCVKVLPLSTIVRHSGTLSDQVAFAATWAANTFDELIAICR